MILSNLGQPRFKWRIPQCAISHRGMEAWSMIRKSMPSDLIRGWVPVFPRDKREAFAQRSCSNKKTERDDDSKKSHPALVPGITNRYCGPSFETALRDLLRMRSNSL